MTRNNLNRRRLLFIANDADRSIDARTNEKSALQNIVPELIPRNAPSLFIRILYLPFDLEKETRVRSDST